MAVTLQVLQPGVLVAASATTYYTATNVTTRIDKCTVTNDHSSAETISIHIVPSGGSADNTNRIIKSKSLAAGECYTCPEMVGQVVQSGATVQAVAGNASRIMLRMSGVEVT